MHGVFAEVADNIPPRARYAPYMITPHPSDVLYGKPALRVGDSCFSGDPTLSDGLQQHFRMVDSLVNGLVGSVHHQAAN